MSMFGVKNLKNVGNNLMGFGKTVGSSIASASNEAMNKVGSTGANAVKYTMNEFRKSPLGASAEQQEAVKRLQGKKRELRFLYNDLLSDCQNEWKDPVKIRVSTVTWNVAEQPPTSNINWSEILCIDEHPDVIAVGLQEVDMTPLSMLEMGTDKLQKWEENLHSAMQKIGGYVKISPVKLQLVGLALFVYIKGEHRPYLKNTKFAVTRAGGALGMVGNKGSIGFRFSLYCKRFVFITCHLPAHQHATIKRNQAFHATLASLNFQLPVQADDMVDLSHQPNFKGDTSVDLSHSEPYYLYGEKTHHRSLAAHDYIFWFGDLNYRIDMEYSEVKQYLGCNDIKPLLSKDQLFLEIRKGDAFRGFVEPEITFHPTYKYDTGTQRYDSSAKHRIPAWCDRCLYAVPMQDKEAWLDIYRQLSKYALLREHEDAHEEADEDGKHSHTTTEKSSAKVDRTASVTVKGHRSANSSPSHEKEAEGTSTTTTPEGKAGTTSSAAHPSETDNTQKSSQPSTGADSLTESEDGSAVVRTTATCESIQTTSVSKLSVDPMQDWNPYDYCMPFSDSTSDPALLSKVTPCKYIRTEDTTSDHRPVSAVFEVVAAKVLVEKLAPKLQEMKSKAAPIEQDVIQLIRDLRIYAYA